MPGVNPVFSLANHVSLRRATSVRFIRYQYLALTRPAFDFAGF